ncbi:hypothetical protein [Cellulomonas sp.]|uniref:hypothetical protein n=1 Tax=Cellulomonas sp. TaxID=40001 RepID=UPI00258B55B0|nr:hypothetical protein [Cellulomonas sp.]MCR6689580.1 hypothetical protein [Cellulomonas sp.]
MTEHEGTPAPAGPLPAIAERLRRTGLALDAARGAHATAAGGPVAPVETEHAALVARWTRGLDVAVAALTQAADDVDASAAPAADDGVAPTPGGALP